MIPFHSSIDYIGRGRTNQPSSIIRLIDICREAKMELIPSDLKDANDPLTVGVLPTNRSPKSLTERSTYYPEHRRPV